MFIDTELHVNARCFLECVLLRVPSSTARHAILTPPQSAAGFGLRSVNDDTKRILSSLGTEEAARAFEAGGGGRKAEAERLLAEAKAGKASDAAGAAPATQDRANSGPDPRLR